MTVPPVLASRDGFTWPLTGSLLGLVMIDWSALLSKIGF
jgi:hypothetical protein